MNQPSKDIDRGASADGQPSYEELRDIAFRIAVEAAALIRRERAEIGDLQAVTETKSSAVDPVTQVDKHSEEFITGGIARLRPEDGILGEEGSNKESTSGYTWVIDPIDGTVNFIYGIPQFAVSIACAKGADIVAGVVINVSTEMAYLAAKGSGAYKVLALIDEDGIPVEDAATRQKLSCSGATMVGESLLATGFAYLASRRKQQAELLTTVLPQVRDIRRMGSAALDLCALAEGTVDCYYEHGIHPWDYAAGAVIASEAGVRVHYPGLDVPGANGNPVWGAASGVEQQFHHMLERAGGLESMPQSD